MTILGQIGREQTGTMTPNEPLHDHETCRRNALERADAVCRARGVRLTALRRRVLDLLWDDHRPATAYELLYRLNEGGGRAAPAAVYRALDFLICQGLAHRLASQSSYIGCPSPEAHDPSYREGGQEDGGVCGKQGLQFLICRRCGEVIEIQDPLFTDAVAQATARVGFRADPPVLEIMGLCARCVLAEAVTSAADGMR